MDDQTLGRFVIERGLLTREQLQECLEEARGASLAPVLLRRGLLTESVLEQIRQSTMQDPRANSFGGDSGSAPSGQSPLRRRSTSAQGVSPVAAERGVIRTLLPRAEAELPPEAVKNSRDPDFCFKGFILTEELGRGGMGVVWKAWQRDLQRWVAIKFLDTDEEYELDRFVREAQSVALLSHPNITALYELGKHEHHYYLVMEFVDGRPLHALLGELSLDQVVRLFHTCALAVDHAHRHSIIHRDIKPHNIMLTGAGKPYLMDFGLAKKRKANTGLTTEGTILGTPAYMPPEQAEGKLNRIDKRSDVYSLGATMYAMIAGRPPFSGRQILDTLYKVVHQDPIPLRHLKADLPPEVEAVVAKAMAKAPADRYPGARELATDLQRYLNGEPVVALPPSTIRRLRRFVTTRWPLLASFGAAVLILAAGAILVAVASSRPEPVPPDPVVTKPPPPAPKPPPSLDEAEAALAAAQTVLRTRGARRAELVEKATACLAAADRALAELPEYPKARLLKGRALVLLDRPEEAIAELERAGGGPEALLELCRSLLGRDDTRAAGVAHRLRAQPLDPDTALYVRAVVALLEGQTKDAIDTSTTLLQRRESVEYFLLRSLAHERALNGPETLSDLRSALNLEPNRPDLLLRAAVLAETLFDIAQADEFLDALLAYQPDHAGGMMRKARQHIHHRSFDEAVRLADRAVALSPDDPELLGHQAWVFERTANLNTGLTDAERTRFYERSVEAAARSLAGKPDDPWVLLTRGCAYGALANNGRCREDWVTAMKLSPEVIFPNVNLAEYLDREGRSEEALKYLDQALNSRSTSVLGWHHLGQAYSKREYYQKALRCYTNALRLNPAMPEILEDRARTHLALKDWERAAADVKRMFELTGQEDLYFSDMGEIEAAQANYLKAVEWLDRSIRLNSKRPEAFRLRGLSHLQLQNWKQAAADLREAIRLNPQMEKAVARQLQYAESKAKTP